MPVVYIYWLGGGVFCLWSGALMPVVYIYGIVGDVFCLWSGALMPVVYIYWLGGGMFWCPHACCVYLWAWWGCGLVPSCLLCIFMGLVGAFSVWSGALMPVVYIYGIGGGVFCLWSGALMPVVYVYGLGGGVFCL